MKDNNENSTGTANEEHEDRLFSFEEADICVRSIRTSSQQAPPIRTVVAPSGLLEVKFSLTSRTSSAQTELTDTSTP